MSRLLMNIQLPKVFIHLRICLDLYFSKGQSSNLYHPRWQNFIYMANRSELFAKPLTANGLSHNSLLLDRILESVKLCHQ